MEKRFPRITLIKRIILIREKDKTIFKAKRKDVFGISNTKVSKCNLEFIKKTYYFRARNCIEKFSDT